MARSRKVRATDRGGDRNAKRWLAVWQLGDGTEASRAFATKVAAEKHAASQETDVDRGTYTSPKDARVRVGQWCDIWLAGYASKRPSTVRQARVHVAQIRKEFGRQRLSAVRPSAVEAWTARLKVEGHEASYIYALHSRLAQIMKDAVHDGKLMQSPCSRRTAPEMGRQRPYLITTEQLWQLHAAMPPYLQVSILLGSMAGLRVAEACGLRPTATSIWRLASCTRKCSTRPSR